MNWVVYGTEVYLWVAYFLILPGFVLRTCIARRTNGVDSFGENPFACILEWFLISVTVNMLVIVVSHALGEGLGVVKYVVAAICIVGIVWLFRSGSGKKKREPVDEWARPGVFTWILVGSMFTILVFQGGLLDYMADGWWHMSYSNRMLQEGSMFVQHHPLFGDKQDNWEVLYPPLWHVHLALVAQASDVPIPVIWHFVAAPSVALLLMALWCLVRIMGGDRKVAVLSVLLHCLLVGGLVSYYRVASWPGNIAYIYMYFAFYSTFRTLDLISEKRYSNDVRRGYGHIIYVAGILGMACVAMVGLHGVELVLFVIGLGAYLLGISVRDLSTGGEQFSVERYVLTSLFGVVFGLGTIAAFYVLPDHIEHVFSSPRAQEPYLNFIVPATVVAYLGFGVAVGRIGNRMTKITSNIVWGVYTIGLLLLVWFLVDFGHIKSLFFPEISGRHVPRDFFDQFGNRVYLPFWDHQLRGALLYSGIIALVAGPFVMLVRRDRLGIFLGCTSILVLLTLTSPYIFTFFSFLIPLPSVYRIHMLLFSPIIISVVIMWLCRGQEIRLIQKRGVA